MWKGMHLTWDLIGMDSLTRYFHGDDCVAGDIPHDVHAKQPRKRHIVSFEFGLQILKLNALAA